jgi:hypothetical protein
MKELAMTHTSLGLPSQFLPPAQALPSSDRPVLALRPSSYNCCQYEVITARYMPDYRPRSPWRDISGDAIGDSGSDQVIVWCYADAILSPGKNS